MFLLKLGSELKGGINLKKGGGRVDVVIGGLLLFYYFTVQSHLVCVWVGGGGRGN